YLVANARAQGLGAGHDPRPARRPQAAPAADRRDRRGRRGPEARAAGLAHRYPRRARVLQERRHPAIRAAPPRGVSRAGVAISSKTAGHPGGLFLGRAWLNMICSEDLYASLERDRLLPGMPRSLTSPRSEWPVSLPALMR